MRYLTYIYEKSDWIQWQWSDKTVLLFVSRIRILHGHLPGQLLTLGFDLNLEAQPDAVTLGIVITSEIEGDNYLEKLRAIGGGRLYQFTVVVVN